MSYNYKQQMSFRWPTPYRAAISLTFDDSRQSNIEHAIPLLDSFEVKATFFVLPTKIGNELGSWQSASRAGHEIGNHTVTHPCSGNFDWSRHNALEDYDLGKMSDELDLASEMIAEAFGKKPVSYAYPCYQTFVGRGMNQSSYVPLVAERFVAGRVGGEVSNDPSYCDLSCVLSTCIDGQRPDQVQRLVHEAAELNRWLVLVAHDTEPGTPKQGVSTETLTSALETIRSHESLWCAPFGEVAQWIQENRIPS